MVIGVAMMAAMIPTVYGLNEASKGAQDSEKKRRENTRKRRSHLVAECDFDTGTLKQRQEVHNAKIYLDSDNKMYITKHPSASMTPFNGCLFGHPDFEEGNLSGLITVSGEEPPQMRWAFLDSQTHDMGWGGKDDREGQISGPFDLTEDEEYVTLDEMQRWMAVKDNDSEVWRLHFDWNQDKGESLPAGTEKMLIFLRRAASES
ncbi:hypothetical protein FE257_012053 [Aspergillus nanangensis]|uniref:Uncharacterized protein n=1 Tax=Aspergillus nanangensis TaxID=2582783 RepID=A0AAD4CH23_ASPNN|nr:hypothetical protein FE257_012053 [Aspergillus nanangensis]